MEHAAIVLFGSVMQFYPDAAHRAMKLCEVWNITSFTSACIVYEIIACSLVGEAHARNPNDCPPVDNSQLHAFVYSVAHCPPADIAQLRAFMHSIADSLPSGCTL